MKQDQERSRDLGATPERMSPSVQCDLCETPFILPAELAAQGVIHGLLVCTRCIEDELEASNWSNQP